MSGLEGLLTGRTLVNRYLIEEVIGRGGFAAVYRAQDQRLGRPVAVKVITYPAPDEETREQLRERFQREARALAALPQHPNLVTVHDFGVDPQLGLDFLVMELLHGENLATFLDRHGRPPLPLAQRILRAAAEGLSLGHRAGLVHRDVKPGNLFLSEREGGSPRVSVLDFGIAQAVAEEAGESRLTRTGMLPHSPAYASPEQMRGEQSLTPASDVFSLGVVGYQLLTGRKPFGTESRTDAEAWRPSASVRELNPEVPPELEAVIRRAMAFDAAERYPDASALAEALDGAAAEETAVVAPPPPLPPTPPADDRTLILRPEPVPQARPSVPVAAAARGAIVRPTPERKRPAYVAWALAGLVLAAATLVGLWAIGRDGPRRPDPIEVAEPLGTGSAGTGTGSPAPRVTVVPETEAVTVPDTLAFPPTYGATSQPEGPVEVPSPGTSAGVVPPYGTAARAPSPAPQAPTEPLPAGERTPPAAALPVPIVPPVSVDTPSTGTAPRRAPPSPRDTASRQPHLLGVPVQRDTTGGAG